MVKCQDCSYTSNVYSIERMQALDGQPDGYADHYKKAHIKNTNRGE